jgi:hypothetical protein
MTISPITKAHAILISDYHSDFEALVAKYPAQEQNRAFYATRVLDSSVVRLRRNVTTKLGAHFQAGDLALRLPRIAGESPRWVTLWSHAQGIAVSVKRELVEVML